VDAVARERRYLMLLEVARVLRSVLDRCGVHLAAVDGSGTVVDQPHGEGQSRFRNPFSHEWLLGSPL
jgi:hypothetical protein